MEKVGGGIAIREATVLGKCMDSDDQNMEIMESDIRRALIRQ
jgi:hypothetical protein